MLERAPGFQWAQLLRQVEDAGTFVLLVGWDSVESHTEDVAQSDLFAEWRAAIGQHLSGRPVVAHYTVGPELVLNAKQR